MNNPQNNPSWLVNHPHVVPGQLPFEAIRTQHSCAVQGGSDEGETEPIRFFVDEHRGYTDTDGGNSQVQPYNGLGDNNDRTR